MSAVLDNWVSIPETGNCMDNTPTRSWDYRVIEFVTEDGEAWRSIHEVHYIDGIPRAYSESPAPVMWERDDGEAAALVTLEQMRQAVSMPVLEEMDFHPGDTGCDYLSNSPATVVHDYAYQES
jgi:hypothetical protein